MGSLNNDGRKTTMVEWFSIFILSYKWMLCVGPFGFDYESENERIVVIKGCWAQREGNEVRGRKVANLDQQNRKWIAGGWRYATCCDQ